MKTIILFACLFIFACCAFGQPSQVEKDFESKKASYTFEHFSEGEDANSGYDYLFYKSGTKIVKIRSIWSATYSRQLRVEDFYFDGDLSLYRKFTTASGLLNVLKKGKNAVLTPEEEFHFTSGKLTKWIVDGKPKSSTDPDWTKTEKEILDQAKTQRDYYKWLKEGKF